MKEIFYRFLAEMVFVFHVVVVVIILFGWVWPELFYLYGLILFITLFSWFAIGHCFLVDLEFYFRVKYNPQILKQSGFLAYYGQMIFKEQAPREIFIKYLGTLFLLIALACWLGKILVN